MKLNWGHKIAIVYTIFVGFMVFMLVLSMQEDHELVTQDYYEQELQVQKKIEANKNLKNAGYIVEITPSNGELIIQLQGIKSPQNTVGKIHLYKPDDSSLDESIDLNINEAGAMTIKPKGKGGRYTVSLDFEVGGVPFYREKDILL